MCIFPAYRYAHISLLCTLRGPRSNKHPIPTPPAATNTPDSQISVSNIILQHWKANPLEKWDSTETG